jgi:DNA-binding Lrp family transcriptional regulator
MISVLDRKIIALLSQDIALTPRPFKLLADKLGIKESGLLARMRRFKKSGVLRKFSVVLNHRKAGFKYNGMAVWDVPQARVEKTGALMASYYEVSHCYERKRACGWNYNLYSMIHARTKNGCLAVVRDISKRTGIDRYKVLFSSKEYKKTGVKY